MVTPQEVVSDHFDSNNVVLPLSVRSCQRIRHVQDFIISALNSIDLELLPLDKVNMGMVIETHKNFSPQFEMFTFSISQLIVCDLGLLGITRFKDLVKLRLPYFVTKNNQIEVNGLVLFDNNSFTIEKNGA